MSSSSDPKSKGRKRKSGAQYKKDRKTKQQRNEELGKNMQKSMRNFLAVVAQQVYQVPAEDDPGDRIPVDDQVDSMSEDDQTDQVPVDDQVDQVLVDDHIPPVEENKEQCW